jgi:hypothetical protein
MGCRFSKARGPDEPYQSHPEDYAGSISATTASHSGAGTSSASAAGAGVSAGSSSGTGSNDAADGAREARVSHPVGTE